MPFIIFEMRKFKKKSQNKKKKRQIEEKRLTAKIFTKKGRNAPWIPEFTLD